MASSCAGGRLVYMLGKICSWKGLSSTWTGWAGNWWSQYTWSYFVTFRDMVLWWIWQCWVVLDDLKGVFHSKNYVVHIPSRHSCVASTLPWQPPALLPPLDDCQIFLFPGNNPPCYLPTESTRVPCLSKQQLWGLGWPRWGPLLCGSVPARGDDG